LRILIVSDVENKRNSPVFQILFLSTNISPEIFYFWLPFGYVKKLEIIFNSCRYTQTYLVGVANLSHCRTETVLVTFLDSEITNAYQLLPVVTFLPAGRRAWSHWRLISITQF